MACRRQKRHMETSTALAAGLAELPVGSSMRRLQRCGCCLPRAWPVSPQLPSAVSNPRGQRRGLGQLPAGRALGGHLSDVQEPSAATEFGVELLVLRERFVPYVYRLLVGT